jgi:hypothetical protein
MNSKMAVARGMKMMLRSHKVQQGGLFLAS